MSTLAVARQHAVTWTRDMASAVLRLDPGMSRKDAARWRGAQGMADLGELVVAWLNGEIAQTPGHCGPPCAETIPLIPVLTAVNRAGYVTDNSQRAGRDWNTWVIGFADDATLDRLRTAVSGTPLDLDACRRSVHGCEGDFWTDACPAARQVLRETWWVYVEDPQPGRNDVLWPALESFAAAVTS